MSLINQVLNELEKRGESVPLGEATLRVVPPRRQASWGLYAGAVAAVVLTLLAVQWYSDLEEGEGVGPGGMVAPAAPAGYELVSGLSGVAPAATPEASAVAALEEPALPASKLSFELSSVPLPDSMHDPVGDAPPNRRSAAPPKKPAEPARAVPVPKRAEEQPAQSLPFKKISPQQHAENEYRKANLAAQEGRSDDALAGYEDVLRLDPLHHAARRALVGVLLGLKRNGDAERVLQKGLKLDTHETSLAMLLARLQVERDAVPIALETLQKALPYAEGQADYHAFTAALLQRQERHKEAITHFQIALQLAPGNGVWLMGIGISLQAVQRNEDARAAYRRALASNGLNVQLQAFVQKKLGEL